MRNRIVLLALFLITTATLLGLHVAGTAAGSFSGAPDLLPAPSCRYGVAALNKGQIDWLDDLGAGWYLNFSVTTAVATPDAEFVHVISVKQDKLEDGTYLPTVTVIPPLTAEGLGSIIDYNPGDLWIVGNEVDRGPDPGQVYVNQGDTFPDVYATAYHDVYHYIKGRDPTAQVANSALVQITPGRISYLDQMIAAYQQQYGRQMPVDVWNMHLYVLPEVNPSGAPNAIANVALGTDPALGRSESYDPDGAGPLSPAGTCALDKVYCFAEHDDIDVFAQQVVAMRAWMANHGYRATPLILSEFGMLYPYVDDGNSCFLQDEYGNCFTPARVATFLQQSTTYLQNATSASLGYPPDNNRLVQQWLWFSVNNKGVGYVSNLTTNTDPPTLSLIGQTYQSIVAAEPSYVNLYPERVNTPVAFTGGAGQTSVRLSAWAGNNGTLTAGAYNVTFYADEALSQVIGTVAVPGPDPSFPGTLGCARRTIPVSVDWYDLTPGMHRFWVEVDSGDAIVENPPDQDGEADNVLQGIVLVDPPQVGLPVVGR